MSEELLAAVFDRAEAGLCLVGPDYRVRRANALWLRSTGLTAEQAIGKSILDILPESRELVLAVQAGAQQDESAKGLRHKQKATNGRETWWEESASLVPMEGGTGILITARKVTGAGSEPWPDSIGTIEGEADRAWDTTERRDAEEALWASENLLRQFVLNVPGAVAMFDTEMRYILASKRWLVDYRLSDADIIGRSHYEIFPDIPQRWKEIHQRCLAGAVERCDEDPFVRADGTVEWTRWEIQPWRDVEDKIGGIIMFTEVITERKEAEAERERLVRALDLEQQRWRTTVESMLELVAVCDARGQVTYFNPAFLRHLGHAVDPNLPMEEIPKYFQLYRLDGTIFTPDELPLQMAALSGKDVPEVEVVEHAPNRRESTIVFNAAPLRDSDGLVVGAVAVGRDVTELRRLEQSRNEYISLISHDLRTPLTVVQGQAQMLGQITERPEAVRRSAEAIFTSARRMNAMIQDLVDSTRLESGQLGLECIPVDMASFLFSLKERMATAMDTARVEVALPEEVLPPVWADPNRLERIMVNLLSNALKYSPLDSAVTVCVCRSEEESGKLRVSVADRGIGIPESELSHIFERFYRTKGAQRRREGIGLGLYITRMLVEAHGGRIWAESTQGVGSTFSFTLPEAGR